MKKIITFLMIVMMLITVTACGNSKKDGYDKDADLFEQAEKLNKNDLSEDEIKDVEKRAELDGYTMYWKDDGKLVLDINEELLYLDGEWVDNRFTKLIKKPSEGILSEVQVHGNRCSFIIHWTAEQAKEYASKVKDNFKNDAEEKYEISANSYTYYGLNDDGVELAITRSPSISGIITVTFPEN